jgi:stress responsive alpha/beta barrel protein
VKTCKTILFIFSIVVIFNDNVIQAQSPGQKNKLMVRHTVIFTFKQAVDSSSQKEFFDAAQKLAVIPGVKKFELLKQTSKKNKFHFGISMEFDDNNQYDQYNKHKDHALFIQQYWLKYVEDFLETDYSLLK